MSKAKLFSPARKEAGFTLIELLTVIVIIGILAAIAIPVFTSQRARAQDSQTISDVRNIAVQAETIMSDPTKTYDDVTKANIDFASSKNVSWNISGKASLGGYCIVAKNEAGKKYTTDATALTYDSLAGGVGQSGKACNSTSNPVAPNGSTGVGSLVAVNVAAPTSVGTARNSQTSVTVNWTIPTDTTVTGYVLQRSATTNDADFTTVGTITSRTTSTFTDTSAPSTAAYYRLMSTTADGTSSQKSNVANVGAYVAQTVVGTFNATGTGSSGTRQSFTITDTGTYKIEAWGAQGGSFNNGNASVIGGQGAYAAGTISVTAGTTLAITVGQQGSYASAGGVETGGGGGTFVVSSASGAALVVAGGGGGATKADPGTQYGQNGQTTTTGGNGTYATNGGYAPGFGGANGGGGGGACGGGGGGFGGGTGGAAGVSGSAGSSDGTGGTGCSGNTGGRSYNNGSAGGTSPNGYAAGGYGGGGSTPGYYGGGGGGGYSGGGATYHQNNSAGGGGSYVIGSATNTELNNTTKAQNGAGKVVITRVG